MSDLNQHATPTDGQTDPMHLKLRFYQSFQEEVAGVEERINSLADTPSAGKGRNDAIDHCLAGIARLNQEVKDASSYISSYDQKQYTEAIKVLNDKFQALRNSIAPKAKFKFSSRKSAAVPQRSGKQVLEASAPVTGSGSLSLNLDRKNARTNPDAAISYPEDSKRKELEARTAHDEVSSSLTISHKSQEYVDLGSTQFHEQTGSFTDLDRCVIVMSKPSESPSETGEEKLRNKTLTSLSISSVERSLIVCGNVSGPAHITGLNNCVLVVSCRQFRMHQSRDTDVYLSCSSRPIIEDCQHIRFAPLPGCFGDGQAHGGTTEEKNMWNQIDDFKWLKTEQSPNWTVMSADSRLGDFDWLKLLARDSEGKVEVVLEALGIMGQLQSSAG